MYTTLYQQKSKNFFQKKFIKKQNKKYINNKLQEYKDFLDNINGKSLDKIQREIVVTEEDSTLVIAGAGSGKSLTIVAKILYLIKEGISKEDILVLSFTNEASNSLRQALLKNGVDMNVMTFHKLGRQILKENGYSVAITPNNTLDNIIDYNIRKCKSLKLMLPDMYFVTVPSANLSKIQNNILLNTDEVQNLKKLLNTFINLFKSGNKKEEDFDNFQNQINEKNKYLKQKHKVFLKLAKRIYQDYEYHLNKNKQIDFHDMINKSIDIINKKGIHSYKYIIIDEYQDTSIVKCNLIRTIKQKTNSKLLAVGDDFQSIYRFTGTNLKVFTNFKNYFPYSKIFKLEKTYRNSKELLNITSKFILKNKNQIYKNLSSEKTNNNPIYIYYYDKTIFEVLNKIVKKINKDDFLVLGRNNKDLKGIKYKNMTVHKSKGLEAENVIIVNLEDKLTGFPNKIINDKVLKYVLDEEDEYPYEEERRLFYVALTRTKNSNYLLVNIHRPSIFVKELINDNPNIKIMNEEDFCPKCHKKLTKKSSKYGNFYSCSGYPKCKYTKNI